MLWGMAIFLIMLLLASLYSNYDVYESIILFIMFVNLHVSLSYAILRLTNTSLPTFKTFIKDLCSGLITLLDYVKNWVDDTSFPNLPNPIMPNLAPNLPNPNHINSNAIPNIPISISPPSIPSSSHTYDGAQARIHDNDV
jgi:hypothetical protein